MDDRWVDRLARGLAEKRTRRGGLARAAAGLLAVAAAGTAGAGQDGKAAARRRRRNRCRPACRNGYACVDGACACASGVACGEMCCSAGESCLEGACRAAPPPPECVGFGEPCKGVGRPCCDGLACGSGPGGMADVACYRPAGGACRTTDDCVFGSTCTDGVCVANPLPQPCTVCPTGCPYDSVAKAVADAAPGATVTVAAGTYDGTVTIDKDLTLEACDGGRPVIRNGPEEGPDGMLSSIAVTAGRVTLRGLAISCSTCDGDGIGGGLGVASTLSLEAASRVARRLGSVEAIVADPRRTMRLGRAAFSPHRRGGRAAAPRTEVTAIDCLISGVRHRGDVGSAVLVVDAALTLTDTVVTGNQGVLGGGALAIAGALTLDGETEVRGNSGLVGSGVFALGDCFPEAELGAATVTMRDRARIIGNDFLPESVNIPAYMFGGGGITLWAASLEMTGDSAVEENLSPGIGGGIAVLSGLATLGCDGCPGIVRVARNAAMGISVPGSGGGVALFGYGIGPVESTDARLIVRRSARIVDNVAYGLAGETGIPGEGGGIFAAEASGAVVVDLTTASSGDDPAVTRNRAVPYAAGSGARDAIAGVGGVVYLSQSPSENRVPGVSPLTVHGNEGVQCGGTLNPDCKLPG